MQSNVDCRRCNAMLDILVMLQRYINGAANLLLGQAFIVSCFTQFFDGKHAPSCASFILDNWRRIILVLYLAKYNTHCIIETMFHTFAIEGGISRKVAFSPPNLMPKSTTSRYRRILQSLLMA